MKWCAYRASYGGSFGIGEFEGPDDVDLAIMLALTLFEDFPFAEDESLAIARVEPGPSGTYWQAVMESDL